MVVRKSISRSLVSALFHAGILAVGAGSRFVSVPVPVQRRMVVGVSLRSEQVTEHASEVCNVRLGLKLEGATVGKVFGELRRASLAECGDGDRLLLLHDELVLLRGRLGLESLPRESSLQEVNEDVPNGLKIVTTGLFNTQVVVDGCVTRSTRQRSSFTLGDMLKGAGVTVSLRQTEIDTVDEVSVSTTPIRDEVGGFDITVDQVARMHQFDTLEHLIGYHEHRLEGESTTALVELILQRRSEKVHDHEIVRILGSKVVDFGESRSVLQFTVDLVFVTQLRASSSMLFELDGNLLTIGADSEVNVPEGTSSNALGDSVFRNR
mmetsp:Transcript_4507/g.10940  ORF Transcript_4507/g.10940 Transcript_4507/m.10940 type:complete len:322 (-) Transcript_4507:208-1173(-)